MTSIRELLAVHRLSHIADQVVAAAKPSVLLVSTERSEDACSRLGGQPNLPDDLNWPTWRGDALPFVAQLDLCTLPQDHGLNLPASGSLYFFYEGGQAAWGFRPEDKGSSRVIYSPSGMSDYLLRSLPKDIPDEMRFTSVRLEPGPSDVSFPDPQDQIVAGWSLSPTEHENYFEFIEDLNQERPPMFHRVGGYPDPVQGDPKLEAHLVSQGLYCGDSSGYNRGKDLGLWPGAAEWVLLLQVDSDEAAGMMWGDVGRLYFLINNQDLALGAFEKAWLIFQCC